VQNVWAPKDSHIFARSDFTLHCVIYSITCRLYHTLHVRQQPSTSLVVTMACDLHSLGRTWNFMEYLLAAYLPLLHLFLWLLSDFSLAQMPQPQLCGSQHLPVSLCQQHWFPGTTTKHIIAIQCMNRKANWSEIKTTNITLWNTSTQIFIAGTINYTNRPQTTISINQNCTYNQ
jgi:hypothetical protein